MLKTDCDHRFENVTWQHLHDWMQFIFTQETEWQHSNQFVELHDCCYTVAMDLIKIVS